MDDSDVLVLLRYMARILQWFAPFIWATQTLTTTEAVLILFLLQRRVLHWSEADNPGSYTVCRSSPCIWQPLPSVPAEPVGP